VRCHGNVKKPTEVAHEKCMSCHDTTKLAEKTASVKPKNPYNSPHYGKDADCNLCHHQHAKSENYCAQCHEKWEFKVPCRSDRRSAVLCHVWPLDRHENREA